MVRILFIDVVMSYKLVTLYVVCETWYVNSLDRQGGGRHSVLIAASFGNGVQVILRRGGLLSHPSIMSHAAQMPELRQSAVCSGVDYVSVMQRNRSGGGGQLICTLCGLKFWMFWASKSGVDLYADRLIWGNIRQVIIVRYRATKHRDISNSSLVYNMNTRTVLMISHLTSSDRQHQWELTGNCQEYRMTRVGTDLKILHLQCSHKLLA